MEKRAPQHGLEAFKRCCRDAGSLPATETALRDAATLLFERREIVAAIQSMQLGQFYKSMTACHDRRRWQDVYQVPWDGLILYVKFTDSALTAFTLLSFKEK